MKAAKTTVELSTKTQNDAKVESCFKALCETSKSYHAQIFIFIVPAFLKL